MLGIDHLRGNQDLYNEIDWKMTPEEAVSLYLEWGNSWNHGMRMIKSSRDVSYYFVVNTWEERPVLYLVRRNSEGADELVSLKLPPELESHFLEYTGGHKGVWAPTPEVRTWLEELMIGESWERLRRTA